MIVVDAAMLAASLAQHEHVQNGKKPASPWVLTM